MKKLSLLLIVAMLVMVMSACTSTSNTPGAGQAEPGLPSRMEAVIRYIEDRV